MLAIGIGDIDCEIAVVLRFRLLFFVVLVLLFSRELIVWDWLPCLESDLYDLVTDLLLEAHEDAVVLFTEGEAALVQESLNVLQLSIVLILILDLLLEGSPEFLGSVCDCGRGETLGGSSNHDTWTSSHSESLACGLSAHGASQHTDLLERLSCKHSFW